jgi:hypothetical protein
MPRFIDFGTLRRFAGPLALSALLVTAAGGPVRADDTAKPDAKSGAKATGKSKEATSVKDNIKELGRQVSDPGTLQRIKAHEQEFEKKVETKRERQRKDHGRARPSDAVDLAKGLDKPEAGGAPAKAEAKATTDASKKKAEAPLAPPAR